MRLADLRDGDEAWRIAILNGPALTRPPASETSKRPAITSHGLSERSQ